MTSLWFSNICEKVEAPQPKSGFLEMKEIDVFQIRNLGEVLNVSALETRLVASILLIDGFKNPLSIPKRFKIKKVTDKDDTVKKILFIPK